MYQETATKKKDVSNLVLNEKPSSDLFGHMRMGGRGGFVLPSPTKLQSGHMAFDAIPRTRAIHVSGKGGGTESDMDTSSESEDEIYGDQYSLDSSP